jgi:flavodoxin
MGKNNHKQMTVAVFYYTQTGQTLQIAQSVCSPLAQAGCSVIYKEIAPEQPFPYPWSSDAFFQAFPESRKDIPCKIKAIDLTDVANADLVIIAYQAWFLSPSIPMHAFFQNAAVQKYLSGKNVVTIDGCRNMWVMAHERVRAYLAAAGGAPAGHIVLQDYHHNLVSVITFIRWLLYGKKERGWLLPAAGVSDKDIASAKVFGEIIADSLLSNQLHSLQKRMVKANAIRYKPSIVYIEKTGHRLFGVWAKFVLKKGEYAAPERRLRLKIFKYYLFVALYLIAPIGLAVFYLTYPLRYPKIRRDKVYQCLGGRP